MSSNPQFWSGRAEVTADVGQVIQKDLEGKVVQAERAAGSSSALQQFGGKIPSLAEHAKKDLDEGLLTQEQYQAVKTYLAKVQGLAEHVSQVEKNQELLLRGKVAALEETLSIIQKYHNTAFARLNQLIAAQEEQAALRRKQQDEAENENAAKAAEAASRPEVPSTTKPKAKPAPKAKKAKRLTKAEKKKLAAKAAADAAKTESVAPIPPEDLDARGGQRRRPGERPQPKNRNSAPRATLVPRRG